MAIFADASADATVAVIIAAHNAAATIARAVASALAEPEVAEVVVVDDASADDTPARARDADDGSGRLKILVQPENAGPSAARNRAIGESTAPWIGILDADDFFLPGRIARLLACAAKSDLVADDIGQVAEDALDGPRKSLLGRSLTAPRSVNFAQFVLSNVSDPKRQRGELGFLKPLMRREFLAARVLRYREHMRLGEDYELYARALALGARFCLAPAQGYISVLRPDSLSGRHSETDLLNLRDCDRALAEIPGLAAQDKAALRRHYLSVDCRLQWRLLIGAVKARDARAALATFLRPWPVPFYLLERLLEQIVVRTLKRRNKAEI
jgi:succinoglycan biosynthesis protein ExoU